MFEKRLVMMRVSIKNAKVFNFNVELRTIGASSEMQADSLAKSYMN